jgi:2-polyprenyl-6-methoxyphenol hydroxylase-like FAD-dependent oxidoreductase
VSTKADNRAAYDVVIVGAGPTGLLLAGELAAGGARPVILDRALRPAEMPKANGVVGRAAVELKKRGVLKGTGLRVVRPPRFQFGTLTLRLGLLGSPLHALPVPQRRLEELLANRAVRMGAAVLRGHDVTAFEQDDDGVTVHAVVDGGEIDLRARYLVGCDGAHSPVRKRLGIGFPGVTSPDLARIARITIPTDAVTRSRERIDIRGVGSLVPFRPNRTGRGSVTIAPVDALDRTAPSDLYLVSTHEPRNGVDPTDDLDEDDLRASLRRLLGADLPFTEAHAARSIVANSRQAERYRSGRVFLAGDAAHIFSAGGSAINVGLLDAIALGDRLARVLRGEADETVLDGYEAERIPAGRRAIEQTRIQVTLDGDDESGNALRSVLGEVLKDRSAARRIARLLER